jgi:hypothetical protein
MSGLRVVLLAFAICGVLGISERPSSGAGTESDGSAGPNPEGPSAGGRDVSEVDAFLGTRRSTRIAQIIPDHARACLPSRGGFRTTAAQQGIAAVADLVAQSPLGAWLLEQAAARLVLICQDPNTELAAYYRAQMRLIGLFDRLPDPARIMFLAHELAHVPQHPRYSNDLRFGPEAMLVMHRMREATAEAVATRVLWQLRVQGLAEPWRYKLGSAYGDIAQAFARVMARGGELAELRATRAAFDQWFGRPGRVHSYDARILAHMERGGRSSLARPTRDLTEEFVRGMGWYDGANFLPPGAPPVLSDPYYARGFSPANAAQLDDLLRRAR